MSYDEIDQDEMQSQFPPYARFAPCDLITRDVPPRRDVITGRLPRGKVVVLAAQGGTGKSSILVHLFNEINNGGAFFGGKVEGGRQPCVLVMAEDDEDTVALRLQAMGADLRDVDSGGIVCLPNVGAHQLFSMGSSVPEPSKFFEYLDGWLQSIKIVNGGNIGLVGLDPLSALFGIDENSAADVQACWLHLTALAVKHDVCVIVTHHVRKGDGAGRDAVRGSTAILDGARAAYLMTQERNPRDTLKAAGLPDTEGIEVLTVQLIKDNVGLSKRPIALARDKYGVLTDITSLIPDNLTETQAILQVIGEINARGDHVTTSGPKGISTRKSSNWPKVIQVGRDKLITLINAMLEDGLLVKDEEGGLQVAS